MVEKFLDSGIGYIKSQNGQQVQVYKTEEASGQDLAGALEMFGMCKVAAPAPRVMSESPIPRIADSSKVRSPFGLNSANFDQKIYRIVQPNLHQKCSVRVSHVGERLFHVQVLSTELGKTIQTEKLLDEKRNELRNHPKLKVTTGFSKIVLIRI